MFDIPADELAAAEAHLADCRRCAAIARNRRDLDRRIGRIIRAVDVPEAARQRTLGALAELDANNAASISTSLSIADDSVRPDHTAATLSPGSTAQSEAPQTRRRFLTRGWIPAVVCLLVGAIAFFGVVWFLTPRWTVDEVCQELAKIDFDALKGLPGFKGDSIASRLPSEPGWQSLQWCCDGVAKGVPSTAENRAFAVYGFVMRQGNNTIHGLVAVIPVRRMRNPPAADSLSTAAVGDYRSARIGETVTASWTNGNVVVVCMVQGGADSLEVLQRHLNAPPA
jgi:hypothetical protein